MPVTRGVAFVTFNGYNLSFEYLDCLQRTNGCIHGTFLHLSCFFFVCEYVCMFIECVCCVCVFSNPSVQMVSTLQLVLLMGVCLCGRWPQGG